MRLAPCFAVVIASSAFLFAGSLSAQRGGQPPSRSTTPTTDPFANSTPIIGNGAAGVEVTVADETGTPLSDQALVKFFSQDGLTNTWGTTQKRSQVTFSQVTPGTYEIEASAAGYATTTQTVNVISPRDVLDVEVRLKKGSPGDVQNAKFGQLLSPKALKEAEKGLAGLKSGNLADAQKHLDVAYKLAPTDADINYLMGFLCEQKKDVSQAEVYFVKATSFNPKNMRALTSLGQLLLAKGDYKGATAPLEKAISVDAASWQAHWDLSTAYLHQKKFEEARQQAQLAIETGKGAANDAELLLGEALAYLGKDKEAIQALQTYLQANPKSQTAPAVRDMIAQLQSPPKPTTATQPEPVALNVSSGPSSSLAAAEGRLSIPTWSPLGVDEAKPVIAEGAVCPSQVVIEKAGERVKQLVDNLSSFEATEDVLHENLDELGQPISKETRKFDYMASISEPKQGILKVDEYRNGLTDQGDFPTHIATMGLPALAFVFHPDMRDNFDLVCEGLSSWQGHATWLVHFRQRLDKPSNLQGFQFDDGSETVDLKGRAWIAAGSYQIVRLEADLVAPVRRIQLYTEHQTVEYGPVEFKNRKMQLWLPKSADLYMDFRRQRFHRRHSFGHYMLFSVGSSQKISQPKIPDPQEQKPD